jgi:hypothetical protein
MLYSKVKIPSARTLSHDIQLVFDHSRSAIKAALGVSLLYLFDCSILTFFFRSIRVLFIFHATGGPLPTSTPILELLRTGIILPI